MKCWESNLDVMNVNIKKDRMTCCPLTKLVSIVLLHDAYVWKQSKETKKVKNIKAKKAIS